LAPSSNENNEEGAEKTPPPDWGEIFTEFVCHTNITKSELINMSIPEIQAYRNNLGKNIAIKIGIPNIFGGPDMQSATDKSESSQEDVEAFFGSF